MSFILDALRKSEHERQRQTGPALVEVAAAPPRQKANRWATAAIALLLVNLVAIGVLLLVKSRDEPAAPGASATPAPVPAMTGPAGPSPTPAAPDPAPGAQASVTRTLPQPAASAPPVLRPADARAPVERGNPLEREVSADSPAMEPAAAAAAAAPPRGPAAVQSVRRGSVVYESLPEADPSATDTAAPALDASDQLPTADEIVARGGMPELKLELHVFSNKPQERFVFINGSRYREGDTIANGAMIVEITRDGVIMSSGGNRFLLPRD